MRRCWTGRPFGAAARGTAAAARAGVDLVSVRWLRNLALGVAAVTVAGCGGSPGRVRPPPPAAWVVFRHLPGVVDLAGPRSDGSFLVAAAGRLLVLGRDGTLDIGVESNSLNNTAHITRPNQAIALPRPS